LGSNSSDDFLGQCNFDLSYVPAFSTAANAPASYTKMPERKEAPHIDVHHETSLHNLRRWSLVQSKRNLDPSGQQDDATFFHLLHGQMGLGGSLGRFYWVNKGSILLQKSQSFTTSEILAIETGSTPAHITEPLPLSERACYLIVTAEEDVDDRAGQNVKNDGKLIVNLQTESANVVREWCCQLTQVMPMIRVVDKAGTLVRQSARQVISTASMVISVACDHFEKHLFRKRDLCRTCGLTRDEHAPEHRGKRVTVSSPSHKAEPKPVAKAASQSMKVELPSKLEEAKFQRQDRER